MVGKYRAPTTGLNEDWFSVEEVWRGALEVIGRCVRGERKQGRMELGRWGVFEVVVFGGGGVEGVEVGGGMNTTVET